MRGLLLVAVLFLLVLLTPSLTPAFYHRSDGNQPSQQSPTRLVVKLKAEIASSIATTAGGTVSIGMPAFDIVNEKYGIVRQASLYPPKTRDRRPDRLRNVYVVSIPDGRDIDSVMADYRRLDMVEYVHPDWEAELYEVPDDPLYSNQWALNNTGQGYYHVLRVEGPDNDTLIIEYGTPDADIDAHEVFENPPDQTSTVVVAIVDTGADMLHPELAGRIWVNPDEIPDNETDDDCNGYIDDVCGWDFCNPVGFEIFEDNDPTDSHGHGTHCAGIVAAIANNGAGVAGAFSDCRIMPLKFSPVMLSSLAARAIVYAADNGADIISMSFGYPWPVQVLEDALSYARSRGVVLCASSGNDGAEKFNYPASCPGVITVGASNSSDEVTDFSTYGPHVEICAPGLSILSLRARLTDMYARYSEPNVHIIDSYYYLASGTSMSCPYVAAAVAYLRAVSPGVTPDKAQDIIEQSADDIIDPFGTGENYPGYDIYSGHGRLNLRNAIDAAPKLRARIESPSRGQKISGIVQITGTADGTDFTGYVLEYGAGADPLFWTGITSSSSPVTGGILGQWDTDDLNGIYTIRLRTGETNISSVVLYVINAGAAIANISSPQSDDTVMASLMTTIAGIAVCPDFSHYRLDYGLGENPGEWWNIATIDRPVPADGLLLTWNSSEVGEGVITVKLSVFSNSGLETEHTRTFFLKDPIKWRVNIDGLVALTPNYGDFDNDGSNEIILGTENGILFFNPDGTPKTTGTPNVPPYDFRVPPAVGDLDGDGIDDFVAVGVYQVNSGKLFGCLSSEPDFERDLSRRPEVSAFDNGELSSFPVVFLKDIDGDGRDEIHYRNVGGTNAHYFIYDGDGSLRFETFLGSFRFLPADLDNDGVDEFYEADKILYQYDINGVLLDSFDLRMGTEGLNMKKTQAISAADVDFDGQYELVVFGFAEEYTFVIYIFDEGLILKDGYPHDTGIDGFLVPTEPVIFDMDYDGRQEYFVTFFELAWGQIMAGHIDGTCYLDGSTTCIFSTTVNPSMVSASVFADVDGDGFSDAVTCAKPDIYQTYPLERIVAWDKNGRPLEDWPLVSTPDASEYYNIPLHVPAVGDVDKDGYTDILMTTMSNSLLFVSLVNSPYNPERIPSPFWRYNRRLNNTGLLTDTSLVCGDLNHSKSIDMLDIMYLIAYLYKGGPRPFPLAAADVNADTEINMLDVLYLIRYLYKGGPEPVCL